MGQKWAKLGHALVGMGQKWVRSGSEMGQKWAKLGHEWVTRVSLTMVELGQKCAKPGQTWVRDGLTLAKRGSQFSRLG